MRPSVPPPIFCQSRRDSFSNSFPVGGSIAAIGLKENVRLHHEIHEAMWLEFHSDGSERRIRNHRDVFLARSWYNDFKSSSSLFQRRSDIHRMAPWFVPTPSDRHLHCWSHLLRCSRIRLHVLRLRYYPFYALNKFVCNSKMPFYYCAVSISIPIPSSILSRMIQMTRCLDSFLDDRTCAFLSQFRNSLPFCFIRCDLSKRIILTVDHRRASFIGWLIDREVGPSRAKPQNLTKYFRHFLPGLNSN